MWKVLTDELPIELVKLLDRALREFIADHGVDKDRHFDSGAKSFFTATRRNSALLRSVLSVPVVKSFYTAKLRDPVIQHAYPLIKAPGGPATTFHQDRAFWTQLDEPPTMFTLWVAITRVVPENGCLRMAPGKGGLARHRDSGSTIELASQPSEAADVPLQPGQILFFDSFQRHGAHPNTTPEYRLALKIVFAERASMRQSFYNLDDFGTHGLVWKARMRQLRQSMQSAIKGR
jgi:ectoine hydroxylase-related dioxygenase (phytanoyl-CoA dioxygenase family)